MEATDLKCTVMVPSFCGKPATEVLHVKEFPFSEWSARPRCADHPAESWLPMISKAFPMAEVRIEKLA